MIRKLNHFLHIMESFKIWNLVRKKLFSLEKARKLTKKGGGVQIRAGESEIFLKKNRELGEGRLFGT